MKKKYADGGNVTTSAAPTSAFAPTPVPQQTAAAPNPTIVAPQPPAILQSPGQQQGGPQAQSLYPGPAPSFPMGAARPFKKGGTVKAKSFKKGGSVKSSGFRSSANGLAQRGKTKGSFK